MIDLRTKKSGGTWVRRFGDHEAAGVHVSLNDASAHVSLTTLQEVTFSVDREDVPAAWAEPIDAAAVRAQLLAAVVRHMTVDVLGQLIGALQFQRDRVFRDGERAARDKIREALGL